jgi:type I restriction-modification system DNA methylase subunit
MNPPFSPMTLGYQILYNCINMSDNIIALMPWLTIINSERRTKKIIDFGLKSITHLPRNIFPGSRVQTCILEIKKGYSGDIKFINYANLL